MNIRQAKDEIKNTVRAYLKKDERGVYEIPVERQRPVLLMGAPGLGKTAVMRQIAQEEGIGLVAYNMTHHTRQSALGLPLIRKEEYKGEIRDVTRYTMSEIVASVYDCMNETGLDTGILFLDEINCVSETLAPVILQLLQTKTFGRERVPDGWIIVAAGNPEEYNTAVREFDMATLDRVRRIDIEPDLNTWRMYASQADVAGEVLSYLNIRKENFYKAYITADGMNFVTARGWEDLSDLIKTYNKLGISVGRQQVEQYINDPEIAADFANYLLMYKTYEKAYPVKDVLAGNVSEELKSRLESAGFDEKISFTALLLSALGKDFKASWDRESAQDVLYDILKSFQKNENGNVSDFLSVISEEEKSAVRLYAENLLSGDKYKAALDAFEEGRRWGEELTDPGVSGESLFEKLRGRFFEKNEGNEDFAEEVKKKLDNVFDFFEKALPGSPQLLLFVTELAGGFYSLEFIRNHDYKRFFDYNKSLLSGAGEEDGSVL